MEFLSSMKFTLNEIKFLMFQCFSTWNFNENTTGTTAFTYKFTAKLNQHKIGCWTEWCCWFTLNSMLNGQKILRISVVRTPIAILAIQCHASALKWMLLSVTMTKSLLCTWLVCMPFRKTQMKIFQIYYNYLIISFIKSKYFCGDNNKRMKRMNNIWTHTHEHHWNVWHMAQIMKKE